MYKYLFPCREWTDWGSELLSNLPRFKGGGWEDQPHVQGAMAAQAQEGLEELSYVEGKEGQRWGDTPRPR